MARVSKDTKSSGQPRWTYVVGALVLAGGLLWTIISHFVPSRPPQPIMPSSNENVNVSVTGPGSVGIHRRQPRHGAYFGRAAGCPGHWESRYTVNGRWLRVSRAAKPSWFERNVAQRTRSLTPFAV